MKNTVKLALGLAAGSALVMWNQRRKKSPQNVKTFTAPDISEYQGNQMYRNA